MRCCELRCASSTVGWTARMGPGPWWMMKPMKLLRASVAPVWAAFMNTTRSTGLKGERFSMISRMSGVRDVRYLPASQRRVVACELQVQTAEDDLCRGDLPPQGGRPAGGYGCRVAAGVAVLVAHRADYRLLVSVSRAADMPFPGADRTSLARNAVRLTPCGERGSQMDRVFAN